MIKKILLLILALIAILAIVYLLGPKTTFDPIAFKSVDINVEHPASLDSIIREKESAVKNLKEDNEARIIWADSAKSKTKFAVVYLHGFSASQEEGDPLHSDFAKRYGCNLYLPRLYDHGRLDSNTFRGLTPQLLYDSAEEALEIGKELGDSVILMSCSTGGTLSIMLAQNHPEIHSFIMYSPNIAIADPSATLTTKQWGKQIMGLVMGGEYNRISYIPEAQKYWNPVYHTDGIIALQAMIDNYMLPQYFSQIKQPLYIGAYYKDEEHQDEVVSVAAMKEFYSFVSTPPHLKKYEEFPNAGKHVISSHIFSKDISGVRQSTFDFADQVLHLRVVSPTGILE